ncbi:MAG TPA: lysophospholipid acyltransferase family protein [Myxococcota bacterium]|nr:lysophospholipid acyltransferase family protein [Myxococcota bacterium]
MLLRGLLHVLSFLFRCLPRRVANGLGAGLGLVWYYLVPIRKGVALSNLRIAFPDKRRPERRRIARKCFMHLGRSAVEFLRLSGFSRDKVAKLVEHRGWENLENALAAGKGVIVATAHLGNFDLMACAEALRGVPLHVVTRRQHAANVDSYWMSARAGCGVGLLADKGSAFAIHKLLKQGRVVALVIDQHMPAGRGMPVDFFGRPASTTTAPALFALTAGAPIVPVTIERLPGGRHRVTVDEPLEIDRLADRQEEVARLTLALNSWLEDKIRKCPEQWLWIHRRFKLGLDDKKKT